MKRKVLVCLCLLLMMACGAALGETYADFQGWQDRFLEAWSAAYDGQAEARVTPDAPEDTGDEPIMVQLWLEDAVLVTVQPWQTDARYPQITVTLDSELPAGLSQEDAYRMYAEALYDGLLAVLGDGMTGDAEADKATLLQRTQELAEDASFPLRAFEIGGHTVMLTRDLDAPNMVGTIMWELS